MRPWKNRGFVQDSDDEEELTFNDEDSPDELAQGHSDDDEPAQSSARVIQAGNDAQITDTERELKHGSGTPAAPRSSSASGTPHKDHDSAESTSRGLDSIPSSARKHAALANIPDADSSRSSELQQLGHGETSPRTPNNEIQDIDDVYGLPFSPLPQSPLSQRQPIHSDDSLHLPLTPSNPVVLVNTPSAEFLATLTSQEHREDEAARAGGRSLRQRNPIQLHPYLLENEAYRKSFRARGLRPVHVAQETQQDTAPFEDSLQNHDSHSSQYSHSSPQQYSSSPAKTQSNLEHDTGVAEEDEDTLPALEALIRNPQVGELRRGHKRRKTGHRALKSHGAEACKLQTTIDQTGTTAAVGAADEDVFDFGRASCNQDESGDGRIMTVPRRRKKFKIPRTLPEDSLPTPVASSELSATRRSTVEGSPLAASQSESDTISRWQKRTDQHPQLARSMTRVSSVVVVSSSSSSSSAEDNDLPPTEVEPQRRYRKKIRGVLPASWLRLDQQVQTKKPAGVMQSHHPQYPQKSPQKGVARRVSGTNRTLSRDGLASTRYSRPVVDLFDRSGEEDNGNKSRAPAFEMPLDDCGFQAPDDVGSAVEEDFIDPMLQPESRRRVSGSRKRYKRQLKLDDTFENRKDSESHVLEMARVSASHHNQSRRTRAKHTGKHRKQWVRRKPPPRLSILDVPSTGTPTSVPNFVRIARRRARNQPDEGQQSPSRKMLSLQTQQDGADVDDVLRDWRAGNVKRMPRIQRPSQLRTQPPKRVSHDLSTQGARDRKHSKILDNHTGPSLRSPLTTTAHRLDRPRQRRPRQTTLNVVPIVALTQDDNPLQASPSQDQTRKYLQEAKTPSAKHLRNAVDKRQGQLEQSEAEHDEQNMEYAFQHKLMKVSKQREPMSRRPGQENTEPLERFLADSDKENGLATDVTILAKQAKRRAQTPTGTDVQRKGRLRKRRPVRVCQDQIEPHRPLTYKQTSEPAQAENLEAFSDTSWVHPKGLLQYGSAYTTDFGVTPLPTGVCFRSRSFIGSGDLSKAVSMQHRDLDELAGSVVIRCGDARCCLGAWSEECSSNLRRCMAQATQALCQRGSDNESKMPPNEALEVLRGLVFYFSNHLSFADAIDRRSFTSSVTDTLETTIASFKHSLVGTQTNTAKEYTGRALLYLVVLAFQAQRIALSPLVSSDHQSAAARHEHTSVVMLAHYLMNRRNRSLIDFHDSVNIRVAREFGIREADADVEAIVGLHHVLQQNEGPNLSFWKTISDALLEQLPSDCTDVAILENLWHELFALQPLLEIDMTGTLRAGSRRHAQMQDHADCSIVKMLLTKTFALAESATHHPTLNAYIRAVLIRCFRLVRIWSWYKSEPILGCAYDFFAKRGFAFLATEEGHGSAIFLERLHLEMMPHIDGSDRSFHIFLKMLAAGLMEMQNVYPDKKIRNLVWRFVPNHGRAFQKDQDIRQADLDTLRNHHDLLSVLYYASPPGMRPSLVPLRNLVDYKSSHAEVCKVGVRAWSNLARFQLSAQEPVEATEPFVKWFEEIVTGCAHQHRLAQMEAEAIIKDRTTFFSHDVLQATVVKNQREVENVLEGLLGSFSSILRSSSNFNSSRHLFEHVNRANIFQFDRSSASSSTRCSKTMVEAYQSYLDIVHRKRTTVQSGNSSEDSQDYGDIDLDDIDDHRSVAQLSLNPLTTVVDEIFDLLQSHFNRRIPPDSVLTTSMITAYVQSANELVRSGQRDWLTYLDAHGSGSWFHLPKNEQTNKFTPYFVAAVLSHDCTVFSEHAVSVQSAWIECLVERDPMLKYQHLLTSTILNVNGENPLVNNLPFAVDAATGKYAVTLDELRMRRISLLSSIISNIRQIWEASWFTSSSRSAQQSRDDCLSLLKSLMSAMKRNYQETQAESTVRGAYIDFVQTIVQLLQQHISSIPSISIDKFFTDPSTFPLPANDPHYVVGRLRSYEYGVGLKDESTEKKLVKFVQALVERAAAEDAREVLRNQIVEALRSARPQRDPGTPSFWNVMLGTIIPAYVQICTTSIAAWFLTLPLLEATKTVFMDLVHTANLGDTQSMANHLPTVHQILETVTVSLGFAPRGANENTSAQFARVASGPGPVRALRDLYEIIAAAVPFLDLLIRQSSDNQVISDAQRAWHYVDIFASTDLEVITEDLDEAESWRCSLMAVLKNSQRVDGLDKLARNQNGAENRVTAYTRQELTSSIDHKWRWGNEGWVLPRGAGARQIHVGLRGDAEGEGLRETMSCLKRIVRDVGMSPRKGLTEADESFNDMLADLVV